MLKQLQLRHIPYSLRRRQYLQLRQIRQHLQQLQLFHSRIALELLGLKGDRQDGLEAKRFERRESVDGHTGPSHGTGDRLAQSGRLTHVLGCHRQLHRVVTVLVADHFVAARQHPQ